MKTGIKYLTFKGKNVGWIDFNKDCYYSKRSWEKHYFNIKNGFGISENILDELDKEKIDRIILILTDKGNQILETTINQFVVNGIEWTDDTFGEKEKQLILPLKFWNKKGEATEHQTTL